MEPEIIAVITNVGFAGVAFYMMYKFATDTTEKLRESFVSNAEKLMTVVNENTATLREVKVLIIEKLKD